MLFSLLQLNLAALDGVGTAPPVGDGHADGGEEHAEGAVAVEEVVVGVASTDGDRGQVLAYGELLLEGCCLDLLLQEAVFGEKTHPRALP